MSEPQVIRERRHACLPVGRRFALCLSGCLKADLAFEAS
jgi:hypothetical protein